MFDDRASPDTIRSARADYRARSEAHVRNCVLLAVVTSEDVAANLIDQAVALRAAAVEPELADA